MKLLFGTHNPSKIQRFQSFSRGQDYQILSPLELKLPKIQPKENGKDEASNAKIKAKAYFEIPQIPTFSLDTGFYINGLTTQQQPGKHVQRKAGVTDETPDQERFQLMTEFYRKYARQNGGLVEAYFLDVLALFDGSKYFLSEAQRPVILYDQIFEKDVHMPIASLYKVKKFNKFHHQLSQTEKEEFLSPSKTALNELILKFRKSKV